MTQRRVRPVKRVAERPVEQIQEEIAAGANRLETLAGELALAPLLKELERDHFPREPAELERMGTGEKCPSVAFEMHGDLAGAIEALGEAVDGLRRAAGLTSEAVHEEWRDRRLMEERRT